MAIIKKIITSVGGRWRNMGTPICCDEIVKWYSLEESDGSSKNYTILPRNSTPSYIPKKKKKKLQHTSAQKTCT